MSTMDFDLPLGIAGAVASTIDVLTIIAVMASVTWPVLIVAAPAIIAAIYAQVNEHHFMLLIYLFCSFCKLMEL